MEFTSEWILQTVVCMAFKKLLWKKLIISLFNYRDYSQGKIVLNKTINQKDIQYWQEKDTELHTGQHKFMKDHGITMYKVCLFFFGLSF